MKVQLTSFALICVCTLLTTLDFAEAGCKSRLFARSVKGSVSTSNKMDNRALVGSDQIFSKMTNLIATARKNVYLQTWKFDVKSKPVRYLKKGIAALAKKGRPVNVWLLINVTKFQSKRREEAKLKAFVQKHSRGSVKIHYAIFSARKLGVNHAKSVSIDGNVALVTGANMTHNYDGGGFYDSGYVVRGAAVAAITNDVVKLWKTWAPRGSAQPPVVARSNAGGCLPIAYATTNSKNSFRAPIQNSSLNRTTLALIRNARKSINILTPNLNVKPVMNALQDAILRGVKVRIILSKGFEEFKENLFSRGGANVHSLKKLYWPLVRHYKSCKNTRAKLQVKWYSSNGSRPTRGARPPASHAKYMVIDDQVTVVGSQNMDIQSWANSREIGLIVDSRQKARSWQKKVFNPAFNRSIPVKPCGGPVQ